MSIHWLPAVLTGLLLTELNFVASQGVATTQTLFRTVQITRTTKFPYITLEPEEGGAGDFNPYRSTTTSTTTTKIIPTGSTHPPGPDVFQTNFDQGLGGFSYDNAASTFNWTRLTSVKSPHLGTGPDEDHTTGSGYYMFIRCSYPRLSGDHARIITPELSTTTGCANLTFWYHAYGGNLGRLTVLVNENPFENWISAWEIKGPDENKNWRFASIIVPAFRYKVVFEGVCGPGYQSNYAIDDIYFRSATCPATTPSALNSTNDALLFYGDPTTPAPAGMQGWAVALIVVSVIAVVAAVLLAVYVVHRQKKLRLQKEQEEREEEERRKREIEEEGVIHTDRPYSTRLRSGMAPERPMGRMVASAARRMAPGYGAGSSYGRMDIPASAMSKRGHSPNSALAVHREASNYGYDQENNLAASIAQADRTFAAQSARLRSAGRMRGDDAEPTAGPTRMPSIFGGEDAAAPLASSETANTTAPDIVISHSDMIQPATMRPETPANQQQANGRDEKMGWFD